MSFAGLLKHTCTIQPPFLGALDAYRKATVTYRAQDEIPNVPCLLYHQPGTETQTESRKVEIETGLVDFLNSAQVTEACRLVFGTEVYEVEGVVQVGTSHHKVARVKKVTIV